jgi:hypothetical protein
VSNEILDFETSDKWRFFNDRIAKQRQRRKSLDGFSYLEKKEQNWIFLDRMSLEINGESNPPTTQKRNNNNSGKILMSIFEVF